jgi:hypothetical protein
MIRTVHICGCFKSETDRSITVLKYYTIVDQSRPTLYPHLGILTNVQYNSTQGRKTNIFSFYFIIFILFDNYARLGGLHRNSMYSVVLGAV